MVVGIMTAIAMRMNSHRRQRRFTHALTAVIAVIFLSAMALCAILDLSNEKFRPFVGNPFFWLLFFYFVAAITLNTVMLSRLPREPQ